MLHTAHLEHELSWFFEEGPGAVSGLRSGFRECVESIQARPPGFIVDDLYYDGEVSMSRLMHVSSGDRGGEAGYEMSEAVLSAVRRFDPIATALVRAAWRPTEMFTPPAVPVRVVLQLRFREMLPECRRIFGRVGFAADKARPLDIVRKVPDRGCGNVAHLTPAAAQTWDRERTQLGLSPWVDRLGQRLRQGKAATPDERTLGQLIARQCASIEMRALEAYGSARERVPRGVRRAALARSAS